MSFSSLAFQIALITSFININFLSLDPPFNIILKMEYCNSCEWLTRTTQVSKCLNNKIVLFIIYLQRRNNTWNKVDEIKSSAVSIIAVWIMILSECTTSSLIQSSWQSITDTETYQTEITRYLIFGMNSIKSHLIREILTKAYLRQSSTEFEYTTYVNDIHLNNIIILYSSHIPNASENVGSRMPE